MKEMTNYWQNKLQFVKDTLKFEGDDNLFYFFNIFLIITYLPWIFTTSLGQDSHVDFLIYVELAAVSLCILYIIFSYFLKIAKYENLLKILILLFSMVFVSFCAVMFNDLAGYSKPLFYRFVLTFFLLYTFTNLRLGLSMMALSYVLVYFVGEIFITDEALDTDYISELLENNIIITNAAFTLALFFLIFFKISLTKNKINVAKSFANAIAHEAYNPVSIFKAKAEILLDNLKQNKKINYKEELEEMKNVAQYCMNNIEMILTATKNINKDFQDIRTYSVLEVVSEALEEFYMEERHKEKIFVNESEEMIFTGSKHIFKHVIFNLIKNTIAHAGNYSRVEIWANDGELFFRDDGNGIKRENIKDIFNLDFSTGGIGIGLNFCQNAMKSMEGKIKCESEYGKYTKFIISFK
jgi:signal transduction histidine kinase